MISSTLASMFLSAYVPMANGMIEPSFSSLIYSQAYLLVYIQIKKLDEKETFCSMYSSEFNKANSGI